MVSPSRPGGLAGSHQARPSPRDMRSPTNPPPRRRCSPDSAGPSPRKPRPCRSFSRPANKSPRPAPTRRALWHDDAAHRRARRRHHRLPAPCGGLRRVAGGRVPVLYQAPFGSYVQEVLDPASPLHGFAPDLVVIARTGATSSRRCRSALPPRRWRRRWNARLGLFRTLWKHAPRRHEDHPAPAGPAAATLLRSGEAACPRRAGTTKSAA